MQVHREHYQDPVVIEREDADVAMMPEEFDEKGDQAFKTLKTSDDRRGKEVQEFQVLVEDLNEALRARKEELRQLHTSHDETTKLLMESVEVLTWAEKPWFKKLFKKGPKCRKPQK